MAGISLGTNFDLQAALPLDSRLVFDTIIKMKSYSETSLYDGILSYNKEADKTYQWKSTNSNDTTFGRWQEFSSGSGTGGGGESSDIRDFNTNPIDLTSEITGVLPQKNMDLINVAMTSDLHSHTNKEIIDKLTDTNGCLTYNGAAIVGNPVSGTSSYAKELLINKYTWNSIPLAQNYIYTSIPLSDSIKNYDYLMFTFANANANTGVETYLNPTIMLKTKDIVYNSSKPPIAVSSKDSGCFSLVIPDSNVSGSLCSQKLLCVFNNSKTLVVMDLNAIGNQIRTSLTLQSIQGIKFYSYSDANNYSTTETCVGTWVDGKLIYRSVINIGALPDTSNKQVNHNIKNINKICKFEGIADNGSLTLNVPFVSSDDFINMSVSKTAISIDTNSDKSAYNMYATIEYTKTV